MDNSWLSFGEFGIDRVNGTNGRQKSWLIFLGVSAFQSGEGSPFGPPLYLQQKLPPFGFGHVPPARLLDATQHLVHRTLAFGDP